MLTAIEPNAFAGAHRSFDRACARTTPHCLKDPTQAVGIACTYSSVVSPVPFNGFSAPRRTDATGRALADQPKEVSADET